MSTLSRSNKLIHRLFHIKHSPLRQGRDGPFIFIHINKTAGTSIGKAVGLPIKDHLTAKEIIAKIGEDKWQRAYKFTLVRNPWDKAVSLYEYRRKKNKTEIANRGIQFSDWIKMTHGEDRDNFYYDSPKSFQQQVEWLKNRTDKIDIDFVGKFESINDDFNHIRKVIGLDAELPHLNTSRRKDYRSYYNDETRDIVECWYRDDIDIFGYNF